MSIEKMYASFNGIKISLKNFDTIVDEILNNKIQSHLHLAAASTITEASHDLQLQEILNHGITLCDSNPLSKWLKFKGQSVQQIRGTDLLRGILAKSGAQNKHFFLGGTSKTMKTLIEKIEVEYPSAYISGFFSPPFGEPSDEEVTQWGLMVKQSGANILWIGLGSPKQDFVAHHISKGTVTTVIAVGAAFDFLAGSVREAPRFIQVIGFEWFFRFLSEPRRLWRRYTFGNWKFIMLMINDLTNDKRE